MPDVAGAEFPAPDTAGAPDELDGEEHPAKTVSVMQTASIHAKSFFIKVPPLLKYMLAKRRRAAPMPSEAFDGFILPDPAR